MKIEIREGGKNTLTVPLPLAALRVPAIRNKMNLKAEDEKVLNECISFLRKYIKENGHFVLAEVVDGDTNIIIKV